MILVSVRSRLQLAALLASVLALSACQTSDSSNNTPLQPTVVQPPLSTRTFTGTVGALGQTNTNFTTVDAGTLAVTLTSAGPPSTITLRIGLGQPSTADSTVCVNSLNNLIVDTQASSVPQISITAPAGAYCLAVLDIGQATQTVSFTFTVNGAFGSTQAPVVKSLK
jgi:hypothetical protein